MELVILVVHEPEQRTHVVHERELHVSVFVRASDLSRLHPLRQKIWRRIAFIARRAHRAFPKEFQLDGPLTQMRQQMLGNLDIVIEDFPFAETSDGIDHVVEARDLDRPAVHFQCRSLAHVQSPSNSSPFRVPPPTHPNGPTCMNQVLSKDSYAMSRVGANPATPSCGLSPYCTHHSPRHLRTSGSRNQQ